jgi:hypothetical protein
MTAMSELMRPQERVCKNRYDQHIQRDWLTVLRSYRLYRKNRGVSFSRRTARAKVITLIEQTVSYRIENGHG